MSSTPFDDTYNDSLLVLGKARQALNETNEEAKKKVLSETIENFEAIINNFKSVLINHKKAYKKYFDAEAEYVICRENIDYYAIPILNSCIENLKYDDQTDNTTALKEYNKFKSCMDALFDSTRNLKTSRRFLDYEEKNAEDIQKTMKDIMKNMQEIINPNIKQNLI